MMKVLLVEDDEVDALFVTRLFKKTESYHLIHKEHGGLALEYIENEWDENEKLIVLTDVNMPVMGGLELLKNIRRLEKSKSIPVFVFTSSDGDTKIEEACKLGGNGYLLKPLVLSDFEQVLLESKSLF